MKTNISIIICVISLSGCYVRDNNKAAVHYAETLCASHKGLKELWVYGNLAKPLCNDNKQMDTFQIPSRVLLSKKYE